MGDDPGRAGLDDYAAWLIGHKARQLVGRAGFTEDDLPDLEQELAFDLLRRLRNFDPRKASRKTFTARVVEHHVATLIEGQRAGVRDYRLRGGSLNDVVGEDQDAQVERGELVDEETYLRSTGRPSMALDKEVGLRIDLERLFADLPPELRQLCARLKRGQTMAEISRAIGIPRGTLYERMKELRKLAEDAGLAEYL